MSDAIPERIINGYGRGRMSSVLAVAVLICLGSNPVSAASSPDRPPRYSAEIRWTQYGIPHIEAQDFAGLGFGTGYAFAKENACLLFDTALTVRGERSQFLGPDGATAVGFGPTRNIDSDVFFKSYFDVGSLEAAYRNGSPDALALLQGYVAGANRYLKDTGPAKLPAACRDAAWVRPLSFDDIVLMIAQKAVEASGSVFIKALLNAAPPGTPPGAIEVPGATGGLLGPQVVQPKRNEGGSNAYALGRDLTANGHGLLVGNPHFPWQGHNRFFELQLTLPGRLDVMGATLLPLPVVNIGFNRDVAWSHTVSTGRRLTLVELHLVPGHPLEYQVDGRVEEMHPRIVTVLSRGGSGDITRVTHTIYETRFGPIIADPAMGLNWTPDSAFALADSEVGNARIVEQWLRLDQATSVSEIRSALAEVQGAPWVNTLAADRAGDVLYADYSVVPDVDDALIQECKGTALAQQIAKKSGIPVLDGSRSHCDWLQRSSGSHRGVMPAQQMPSLIRPDYVLNSNDSYWLANVAAPLTGYPSIIGASGKEQHGRTRMGYKALGEIIAEKRGKITAADLERMVLSDRNYVGELIAEDVSTLCRDEDSPDGKQGADVAMACRVLTTWDRKDTAQSGGAAFFREFWRRAARTPNLWHTSFDPENPVKTPANLNVADPVVVAALRRAMTQTAQEFRALGLAPDAALGTVQRRTVNPAAIPIPGGAEFEGVLNEITLGPLTREGYTNVSVAGSSYIQVVTWDGTTPVADALLTYSQSADPDSPHYADQTSDYAKGAWLRLPFTAAQIAADPTLRTQKIQQ